MPTLYLLKETIEMLSDQGLRTSPLNSFSPKSRPLANGDYLEPMSQKTIDRLREASLPGEGPNETIQRIVRAALGKKPS